MSNTAYQRAIQDLKEAGLNPALAYQQGGASTPMGAKADIQNEFEGITHMLSSAAQIANMYEQINKTRADTELSQQMAHHISTMQRQKEPFAKGMDVASAAIDKVFDGYNAIKSYF